MSSSHSEKCVEKEEQQIKEATAWRMGCRTDHYTDSSFPVVEQVVLAGLDDAGLLAFGWDAQSARRIRALLELGVDAVYSDHVDRLVEAISSREGDLR